MSTQLGVALEVVPLEAVEPVAEADGLEPVFDSRREHAAATDPRPSEPNSASAVRRLMGLSPGSCILALTLPPSDRACDG